jgi:thiol-disulfide isomerase/thioredoxin
VKNTSRLSLSALMCVLSTFGSSQGILAIGSVHAAQADKQRVTAAKPDEKVAPPRLLGKAAPLFTVKSFAGKEVSLADFKGKAVVVNFWATWCEACRQEMPWLAELREKYAAQGFEVLGIVTDRASSAKIASAVRSYGVNYPILFCNHATAQAFGGLPELPVSFFIDSHGKIVATMTGANSKQEIEARVREILKK